MLKIYAGFILLFILSCGVQNSQPIKKNGIPVCTPLYGLEGTFCTLCEQHSTWSDRVAENWKRGKGALSGISLLSDRPLHFYNFMEIGGEYLQLRRDTLQADEAVATKLDALQPAFYQVLDFLNVLNQALHDEKPLSAADVIDVLKELKQFSEVGLLVAEAANAIQHKCHDENPDHPENCAGMLGNYKSVFSIASALQIFAEDIGTKACKII